MAPTEKESILIVDDQVALCETLKRFLRKCGYRVASSVSVDEALEHLAQQRFELVLTDVCMPDKDGFELLRNIQALGGNEAVVVMTAFATIEQGVEMIRKGAADYIAKPFRLNDVANTISQVLRRKSERNGGAQSNQQKTTKIPEASQGGYSRDARMRLVGQASIMQRLTCLVERIAQTDSSVLITGATGTGKELVALMIHENSDRRDKPFIDINCSAIPDTLIEAELFGHQRGTFTGADETRQGLLEEASGGTLFLDEIDALGLSSQAKLLRVLQERYIRRVGGRKNIPIDVRIISATNKDLYQAIANGTFRQDLLYRLCVVPLHVPELAERREDLPLLINYFLQQHADRKGYPVKSISTEAMEVLLAYRWPGNVRELENTLEYALTIGVDSEVGLLDLPPTVHAPTAKESDQTPFLDECLEHDVPLSEVERRYILSVLERYDGHQINAAAALGIDRRTLSRKLQQYGFRILNKEAIKAPPRARFTRQY